MCLFSGLFVYLKPKERRKYAAYSGEREMYHHYGMDVIVCYCCVNTAVYIFPIFLINCCYFVVFRIFFGVIFICRTQIEMLFAEDIFIVHCQMYRLQYTTVLNFQDFIFFIIHTIATTLVSKQPNFDSDNPTKRSCRMFS